MTVPLTPEREQEIRARVEELDSTRILPGMRWTASPKLEDSHVSVSSVFDWVVEDVLAGGAGTIARASVGVYGSRINAEFAAHAREDVPALLAEVDRLRAELAGARAQALNEGADAIEAMQNERDDTVNDALGGLPDSVLAEHKTARRAAWLLRRMAAGPTPATNTYPPALPWAALMDDEDLAEFLVELEHAAARLGTPAEALADVEKTCGTWQLLAEAQHAHNTAVGPGDEGVAP